MTYLEECAGKPPSYIEIGSSVSVNGYDLERYRVRLPNTDTEAYGAWHYRISYRSQHLATMAEESALRFANFIQSEQGKK